MPAFYTGDISSSPELGVVLLAKQTCIEWENNTSFESEWTWLKKSNDERKKYIRNM